MTGSFTAALRDMITRLAFEAALLTGVTVEQAETVAQAVWRSYTVNQSRAYIVFVAQDKARRLLANNAAVQP